MTLTLDNLIVRRGEREIISGLSLTVGAGEAVLLSGPNGAGKTTLLRAIAGLLPIEDGVLRLSGGVGPDGGGDAMDGDEVGERCHYVGHLNAVKAQLTVAENARFWAAYLGGPVEGVAEALWQLRLGDLAHIKAGYLSAGQKRRLGLARLLVVARPLWLLDEPLVSLDTASQAVLAQLIDSHVAAGGMAIVATHQPLGLRSARELRLGGGRPGG